MGIRIRRNRRPELWKGAASGLAGGLAAAWVMGLLHGLVTEPRQQRKTQDSTVKAASAISEALLGHTLSGRQKKWAGPAVHFAFGALMGGVYGTLVEAWPGARAGLGTPFGAALYAGAHAAAVPALGLAKPVTQTRAPDEAREFAGHLVYGLTADLVSRAVRTAL